MIPSDFSERKQWFDAYCERQNLGIKWATEYGVRFTCPCCGYPTLERRGADEICRLCHWQDDGQDDPRADEVWGGPNKDYSLTRARENFARFWSMYEPGRDTRLCGPDSDAQIAAKQQVARAFDAVMAAGGDPFDPDRSARLWRAVEESMEALRRAPRRTFGEPRVKKAEQA